MNKIRLAIILCILSAFSLSACSFSSNNTSQKDEKNEVSTKKETKSKKTSSQTNLNVNLSRCDSIKEKKEKDTCIKAEYTRTAIATGDESICNGIPNNGGESCKNSVKFNEIVKTKDVSGCEQIEQTSMKESCVATIKTNEIVASGSLNDCSSLTGIHQENCKYIMISNSARKSWNTQECDAIENSTKKDACYDTVYFALAIKQKDTATCEKIKNTAQKTACKTGSASVIKTTENTASGSSGQTR